ncbi:hypothetical protein D9M72_389840 [compost metagenome]
MQHGAAGVLALQRLLHRQRGERIVGIAGRQLAGIGVVGLPGRARLQDVGPALAVFAREAVGGAFGRRCLQVVKVAGRFLELADARAHMVEQPQCHGMPARCRDVVGVAGKIPDHLVDAVDAQRAEVVAQRAEVAARIGIEPRVDVLLHDAAPVFEHIAAQRQQPVQRRHQPGLVAPVQVAQARTVDGHHADRAGLLGRAEQAVAALEQFAQVQLQAAAHGADHVRLQVGIDEVLEVGQPVARRHLEQRLGVGMVPVEVRRDVVGGDRESKGAPARIALHHHLDVGAVDHVHLRLQVAVGERHLHAGDIWHLAGQVLRAGPVEGEVGEGRLRAPAARHVQVEHQLLHRLAHRAVVHAVVPHERRHVGIEAGKRLRAGPLVLQRAKEVDDLAHGG